MDEFDYLTIDYDDGESVECEILGTFKYEEKEYIALLPVLDTIDEAGIGDVYIYEYEVVDDKVFNLIDIDDDMFDKVAEEFNRQAQEYLL